MASVTFKRTNNIDSVPIVDGQLIFDTSDQKIYLDNGNTREVYGGGSGTDLISNVSDATDNNAFNANATVNLFTRKSSIVDTKAEIQSVTQAGVPLGCKGFNEVVGTGDISALGDGSVTGAILANKSAIDTVNQNLTLNYALSNLPQNTDINTFLQMVLEKLYPARNYVFDGTWKYTTNASTPTQVQCSNVGGFTVSDNMVFMTPPSAGATCKGTRVNSIQNNGKKIYIEGLVNGGVQNYELDATSFSSCNMYLISMKMQGGSIASGIALTDSATVKTTYELITEFPISTSVSSSGYNITAIYIGE